MRALSMASAVLLVGMTQLAAAPASADRQVAVVLFLLGMARPVASGARAMPTTPSAALGHEEVYVCARCAVLSATPCSCATCRTEMQAARLLAVHGARAYCCTCPAACSCAPADAALALCTCGDAILGVSLSGWHVCECPPGCACGVVSGRTCSCACGKERRRVE